MVHLLLLAGDQSSSWQGSDRLDAEREPSELLNFGPKEQNPPPAPAAPEGDL